MPVRATFSVNVPVPLVCRAMPLQRSELIGSEAGTGPSFAQGSTGPPEEEVLGGNVGPQGSALGGVTATREGRRCRGGVGLTQNLTGTMQSKEGAGSWAGFQQRFVSPRPLQCH